MFQGYPNTPWTLSDSTLLSERLSENQGIKVLYNSVVCVPLALSLANPLINTDKKPSSLRLATWNMQQLTNDKINDNAVLEVICLTILRYELVD